MSRPSTPRQVVGARRWRLKPREVSDKGANLMARLYQVLADDNLDYASTLRQVRIEAIHRKIKAAQDPSVWAALVPFEN
ncbi:hypothetical protein OOZ54_15525 [Rhodopseudomonas palustris]|uniref:CHAT domain-containing protein n=1 Tax=Rhodopseudomonas palustris TaxID=1076 RepID=UPI0022F0CAE0|nr:CHAT domain-containing protein [Rhodopseudomonas palustris]WBU28071.1 hypothetical protein OOZ54_15525 [Rhodopseudomonas palustris]